MDRPAVRWRGRLGGTLGQGQVAVRDVDGDGQSDVLIVAGGRLVVKRADDSVISESGLLELAAIVAADDFDGDSTADVLATSAAGRVYCLDPLTGRVQWSTPEGFIGVVGAARVADLDADGTLDLYVADQDSGATGSIPDRAAAFDLGGPSPGNEIWQLQTGARDGYAGFFDLVANIDADEAAEVMTVGNRHLYVFDGSNGALEYSSADLGPIPNSAFLSAAEGAQGPVVAAFTDNSMPADNNSRRVMLLRVEDGQLVLEWERSVSDLVQDRHGFVGNSLGDLDSDGALEVTTSFYDHTTGLWSLEVFSSVDGSTLATALADRVAAIGDLEGDGRLEVLTYSSQTNTTTAWGYAPPAMDQRWELEGYAPAGIPDPTRRLLGAPSSIPLFVRWDGTTRALVLREVMADRTTALVAFDVSAEVPVELGRYEAGEGVSLLSWVVATNVTRPYDQLLVTRSDGYLAALSDRFEATNFEALENIDRPGIRVGGYWSGTEAFGPAPIAVAVEPGGPEDVLVRDSRGFLLRLRPENATLTVPPTLRWAAGARGLASAADVDGDLEPEVVLGDTDDLVFLDAASGIEERRAPVASADRFFYFDLMPVDLNSDGASEVGFEVYDPNTGAVEANFVAADGRELWPSTFVQRVVGGGGGPLTWMPTDGGQVVTQLFDTLFALDPLDGTVDRQATVGYLSAAVVADDLDQTDGRDLLLTGSAAEVRAFSADLDARWVAPEASVDRLMMAVVAPCPDGPVIVQGHYRSPALDRRDARSGMLLSSVVLAGGLAFATTDEARAGGAASGFLASVALAPDDLSGAGPVSVVGSTDGFLYFIDACSSGDVRSAVDIGFSVGEAILADVDGDGADEVVATAADGYLYGIDQEMLAAPSRVFDTDGTYVAHSPADDLDVLVTEDTLWANWDPVDGAQRYEVAILTSADTFVTDPPFADVGPSTSAAVGSLDLADGGRYHFAVRAIGPAGGSAETFSDGVLVRMRPVNERPDAGPEPPARQWVRGGGCTCEVTQSRCCPEGPVFLCEIALFTLVRCRRERRGARRRPTEPERRPPDGDAR